MQREEQRPEQRREARAVLGEQALHREHRSRPEQRVDQHPDHWARTEQRVERTQEPRVPDGVMSSVSDRTVRPRPGVAEPVRDPIRDDLVVATVIDGRKASTRPQHYREPEGQGQASNRIRIPWSRRYSGELTD